MIHPNSVFVILIVILVSCNPAEGDKNIVDSRQVQLFEQLNDAATGIKFNNVLTEDQRFNYLNYDVAYNGGGVALADINNDGLVDIYFTGNQVSDALYLNKGNFQFEHITTSAGIDQSINWSSAVTIGDVNNDGYADIYVCKFLLDEKEKRKNQLFINNGDLTFTDRSASYNVDDSGYTTSASFIDYNKDGWLDLYIGNQIPAARFAKHELGSKVETRYSDKLFKNNGNGTFTDVTEQAGITNYASVLSVTCADINNDGWTDIYVTNDYEEPDFLYFNNGDGTFAYNSHTSLKHMSNFSMGADIADFNNDGHLDIFTADMVAKDNYRLKTNMSGMNPKKFWALVDAGYHHQYMFNALQLNNGDGTFSEIGQMAGVSNTDWSWTSLFADLDLDGKKDLVVTNGLLRDMRNNDFTIWLKGQSKIHNEVIAKKGADSLFKNVLRMVQEAPRKKLSNYMFRNLGDLTFQDLTADWGFDEPAWSQGGAYADLDNDGDLDVVINNMNDKAFVYKNNAVEQHTGNFVKFYIGEKNKFENGIGVRVEIKHGDQYQMVELSGSRGFLSYSETVAHFGIGNDRLIDEVIVIWPDGKSQQLNNIKANRTYYIKKDQSAKLQNMVDESNAIFRKNQSAYFSNVGHSENTFDDYKREILLPYKLSQLGPCIAMGDIDQNGYDDLYIGGAKGVASAIQLQFENDKYQQVQAEVFIRDAMSEDLSAAFLDIDGDNDLDLYVVSGGNEFEEGSKNYNDRIYINGGKGVSWTKVSAPVKGASGGKCVRGDFDQDGDIDLFVSGRQIPGHYGFSAHSFILENDDGQLIDYADKGGQDVYEIGMVTDAAWSDLDEDGDLDLIVVGEWMPITILINDNGLFKKSEPSSLTDTEGWWNDIVAGDFDSDGDDDFLIGNLGLNIKYKASKEQPFQMYVNDFDQNGSHDVYLGYYDGDGVCYPVRGRQCSSQQLPFIKEKFKTYDAFAKAPFEKVLEGKLDNASKFVAKKFEHVYVENLGQLNFNVADLPIESQISPVYGIVTHDWNGDGNLDALMVGNFYQREVETTRSDAGTGVVLLGDGEGHFSAIRNESGIKADQDARDVVLMNRSHKKPFVVVANNNGAFQQFDLIIYPM